MKTCFKCKKEKDLSLFHKHKGMKDGHLNKCADCTLNDVNEWRLKNPSCRKEEHKRLRIKLGFKTREEYLTNRKINAKGRKQTSIEYSHRRRVKVQKYIQTDLDKFVISEAIKLAKLRETLFNTKWHIDHIVPINSKLFCGLHNAFNLQVVPQKWNLQKRNFNTDVFFK